jgi:hypothetical protein
MHFFNKDEIEKDFLPGRVIQKAVGREAHSESEKITAGFARYSSESGVMDPHRHAEEVVYIVSAQDGWIRYGESKDHMPNKVPLEMGIVLHIPELEWHVFEYDTYGHVEILFIYGQVDNIRPEETR